MERHVVLKIQILPAKGHQLSPTQPGGGIEKNHDPFTLRYPNQKSLQFSGVLAKEKIRMQATFPERFPEYFEAQESTQCVDLFPMDRRCACYLPILFALLGLAPVANSQSQNLFSYLSLNSGANQPRSGAAKTGVIKDDASRTA
jgi:hypothetical protein